MDFLSRDRLIAGCNWLMVGTGVVWSVFVFTRMLSVPSEPTWTPSLVADVGPAGASVPAPQLGSKPAQGSLTGASGLAPSPTGPASKPSQTVDPRVYWGNAPYAVHPGQQANPQVQSPLPPGATKDF